MTLTAYKVNVLRTENALFCRSGTLRASVDKINYEADLQHPFGLVIGSK